MSDDKKNATTTDARAPANRGGSGIVGMLLPGVFAAAAAFGGAKVAGATHHAASVPAEHAEQHVQAPAPPGPTLALDPFVLTIPDSSRKVHPMKVGIAVEFGAKSKEEEIKPLVPRMRDAALGYLRTLTYDDAIDPLASDKMRPEILGRLKAAGTGAERILITDLVVQ
jgi:flagellar basal body-associated protein FliL